VSPASPGRAPASRAPARILAAFEERAAKVGLRGVRMAELAGELGMSTRTLYRHFASKDALVRALMASWARRLEEDQAARLARAGARSAEEHLREVAGEWLDHVGRFAPVFWEDLARDHPEAHAVYARQIAANLATARDWLVPCVREELDPQLALEGLMALLRHAADPARCERLRLSRRDAVFQAIALWARGAVRRPGARRPAPREDAP